MNEVGHPVILFDGVCNLCTASVQYVIKHDPEHIFHFASLQSGFGKKVLTDFNLAVNDFNSFILLSNSKIYDRSTAALMVAKRLKGPVGLLYIFIVIPKFIRDLVYGFIAKNRYKWFGRKTECWLPTAELKQLFVNGD
jgi:predicted DCC family thiol-disulfide oxidoreductase YuxK